MHDPAHETSAQTARATSLRARLAQLPVARFHPRLIDTLRGYNRDTLAKDLGAGITVGIVALPLAMAFAIASGVKPEQGLATAIVAGFLISALGGSRVQIGGPAGAFIVIVYGIVERYGVANLLISTMLAGVLLFALGLAKLGQLIRFIPVSIVIGFTNGIAVLVILSQIKDALGLSIDKMPADFFHQIQTLTTQLHTINPWAVLIAAWTVIGLAIWPKASALTSPMRWLRWVAHVPGTMVAVVTTTIVVTVANVPVETIGSRFGGIAQALPSFALPEFSWALVKQLFAPTITIALLGAIESLLCARLADNMIDDRHDPNQELMAQGVANLVTPFFGGIPATGTIARTVTNIKSGARTPVAGMVHALTLLAIMLIAAPLADNVPLAALAGILFFVAYTMGEWREFARLRRFAMTYRATLLVTFVLTVVIDLTVAVEVGLVLACLFFIYRITTLTRIERVELPPADSPTAAPTRLEAYRLHGSLFFGSVGKLEALTDPAHFVGTLAPKVIVLDISPLLSLDTTGVEALDTLRKQLARRGGTLIIAGAHDQPASLIHRSGFEERNGAHNFGIDFVDALAKARQALAELDSGPS